MLQVTASCAGILLSADRALELIVSRSPVFVGVLVISSKIISPRRQDLVSTGASGYEFIKLDAGMTELLRPSLYGAVHPIVVVPSKVGEFT